MGSLFPTPRTHSPWCGQGAPKCQGEWWSGLSREIRGLRPCWTLQHSIHLPLQRRGLYYVLSHGFCACPGGLKIIFYCIQKLWTVHQTADSCTPSDSQAYSWERQKLEEGNWSPSFGLCSGHSGDVFPTSLDQALRFRGLCCSCSQFQNWALCKPRFEPTQ